MSGKSGYSPIARIDWDKWKKQQFVIALTKFLARFPKKKVNRIPPKRKKPEYVFRP